MMSVLNVAGTYSFNPKVGCWTFHLEGDRTLTYYAKDVIVLFERCGHSEFNDYYTAYAKFHTELLEKFDADYTIYFALLVIDLFSPHRFKQDYDMLLYLVPAHARFVQFLEFYLLNNYEQEAPTGADVGLEGISEQPHSTTSPEPSDLTASAASARKRPRVVSRELFDFCMRKLNEARTLEEFLTIATSRIGLSQMLPLMAEICAGNTA